MAKRYYVAPVVVEQDPDLGPLRKLDLPAGVGYSAVIPDTGDWGLAIVATNNHASLTSDSKLVALADFPLDGKLSALGSNARTQMLNRLSQKFGITLDLAGLDAYRDLVRQIGRKADSSFNEDAFDVADSG